MGTYYVDCNRSDDTGDGLSWATAKKTISAAITAAPSGSIILISIGDHYISVTSNTSLGGKPLNIQGEDVDGTKIFVGSGQNGFYLSSGASGSTIQNMTIIPTTVSKYAIGLDNSSGNVISNIIFGNGILNAGYCIYAAGSAANNTIKNSTVKAIGFLTADTNGIGNKINICQGFDHNNTRFITLSSGIGAWQLNNSCFIGRMLGVVDPNGLIKVSSGSLEINNSILGIPGGEFRYSDPTVLQSGSGVININNSLLIGAMSQPHNSITSGMVGLSNCKINQFPDFVSPGKSEAIISFYAVDSNHMNTGSLLNYMTGAGDAGVHFTYFPDDSMSFTDVQKNQLREFVALGHDLGIEPRSSSRLDFISPFSVEYVGVGLNPRIEITYTDNDNVSFECKTDSSTDLSLSIGKSASVHYIGGGVTEGLLKVIHNLTDWSVIMIDTTSSYDDAYAYCLADGIFSIVGQTAILWDMDRFLESEITDTKLEVEAVIPGYSVKSFFYPRYLESSEARLRIISDGFTSGLATKTAYAHLDLILDMYSLGNSKLEDLVSLRGANYAGLSVGDKEIRIRNFANAYAVGALRYGIWCAFLLPEDSGLSSDEFFQLCDQLKKNGVKVLSMEEASSYIAETSINEGNGRFSRTLQQKYISSTIQASPCTGSGVLITGIHDQPTPAADIESKPILFQPNIGPYDGRTSATISDTDYAPTGYSVRAGAGLKLKNVGTVDLSGLTDTGAITCKLSGDIDSFIPNGSETKLKAVGGSRQILQLGSNRGFFS